MKPFKTQFCILLCVAFFPTYSVALERLKLAYSDIESYPFHLGVGSEVSVPPGISLDIINHVADKLAIEVDYIRLPGKRVLQYIQSGRVDGGFIFSYTPQRAKYAHYPLENNHPDSNKRMARLGYYFYKLKDQSFEWDGTKLKDSKQKVIGAHLGFSVVNELKKKNIKVFEAKNTSQLFDMLRSHRLDAIAIQNTTAQEWLSYNSWPEIEKVPLPIVTKDYYLVFSDQFASSEPELVKGIWSTIGATRDDVVLEVSKKYFNSPKH